MRGRVVPISLFPDYADTAYSQLSKQSIPIIRPIMRPIIFEIHLVKLFVFET